MVKIDTILIRPDYHDDLVERNRDLVGFVIDKYTHKVKDVAVIPRYSIHHWYEKRRTDYPENRFDLVIGSISLIGIVAGAETKEVDSKTDKSQGTTRENYGLN
jgi:hypothetical protein